MTCYNGPRVKGAIMNGDRWITTQQAADLSGYHVNHIRRLIRAGAITAQKVSIVWLIERQSLLDYIALTAESSDKRRGPKT